MAYKITQSAYSRVFVIDGAARPDHAPEYMSCMRAGGVDQSFGTVENIECPSPLHYGQFEVVGNLKGAAGRATVDLVGRYARDLESTMLAIARRGCAVDAHVHIGACTDPSEFDTFNKALIFEDALIESWGTGDLGALSSDENSSVEETATISAARMYEVLPLNMTERAQAIVTNEVLDVVICDTLSCGDECEDESDGCQHIYAIMLEAGGSPALEAAIVHTIDKGATWYSDDIDSLGATAPSALACLGDYVVVVSNADVAAHYALKSEIDTIGYDETWARIATGFVGAPNDCWKVGGVLFIVGDGGYVYTTEDITGGVTAVDAASATLQDLYCVHALTEDLAVAAGEAGAIIYTEDQVSWQITTTSPVAHPTQINAVWIHSENVWLIGDSDGIVWYTLNQGTTWTQLADYGAAIHDIAFSTQNVGFVAYATATNGHIRRSYNGFNSSIVLPEGTGVIPSNYRINAIAACIEDPNFVVGVGLADDETDGYIVTGSD